ncbi:MAG: homocysteine S-methyltransferase family protein [Treponema sp.]|nr:homocysteine S-methyltransferase family protein [Treponema sp.]MCL2237864.1 homocysteine S-methyltransferase family protein [Treponema sp.]
MTVREQLNSIAESRIIILDGAMGSLIQVLNLDENGYRGSLFADHPVPLTGCNDVLCLTRPGAIGAIHDTYLEAGADIIETCSFNSTSISLADYGLGHLSYEISAEAAKIARKSADKFSNMGQQRFVAGSIGPTAKGASLYPDINNPGKRAVTWDELEASYYDNARGLLDGGADILLVETIFDTINAKAALRAIGRILEERKIDVPVMISAAVSGENGSLLSGQMLEAFLVSVFHSSPNAMPWSIGLNCSFNAPKLLPYVRQISEITPCLVSAYPNAGIPNKFGRYEENPDIMTANITPYFEEGLVNIIGGCCGTTPAHIAAIADKAHDFYPREVIKRRGFNFWGVFSGLKSMRIPHNTIRLRNAAVAADKEEFHKALAKGEFEDAAEIARDIVEDNAAILNIEIIDKKAIDEKALNSFLDYALMNPYIAKAPFFINSPYMSILETGLKRLQGRCIAGPISLKDGEEKFLDNVRTIRSYGAVAVVLLIDERGNDGEKNVPEVNSAETNARKIEIAGRIFELLKKNNYPVDNVIFDPLVPEEDSLCLWIQDNCPGVIIAL